MSYYFNKHKLKQSRFNYQVFNSTCILIGQTSTNWAMRAYKLEFDVKIMMLSR